MLDWHWCQICYPLEIKLLLLLVVVVVVVVLLLLLLLLQVCLRHVSKVAEVYLLNLL